MVRLLLYILVGPTLACAAGRCLVSSTPQPIAAEGAAELTGPVLIACSGTAPAQAFEGSAEVSFSRRVSNRREGEALDGPVAELEIASGVWRPFTSSALLAGQATIRFDNLRWAAGSDGAFQLRIRGVRVDAAAETIQAVARLYLSERLDQPVQLIAVAQGQPSIGASALNTLATRGPAPAEDADFGTVVRLASPVAPVRVSEGFPAAFPAGRRFLIRFAGVPDGVRMLVPDVVAGSSSMFPTRSGAFGRAPDPGGLSLDSAPQLLLARVFDAQINGEGGRLAVSLARVAGAFGVLHAAGEGRGVLYAVYEVLSGDAGRLETVEIPAWVAVPPRFDTPMGESIVRPTVVLAPLSEHEGAHPAAPVPRFKPVSPAADCESVGDCAAAWFPRMRIAGPAPLSFTAAAGSDLQIGRAGIDNEGGGLLEWRVWTRSPLGSGWLSSAYWSGVQNGGIQYDVNPTGLTPGEYESELVFEQVAPPTGRKDERVFPVRLKVTPAQVTPPVTPPVVPPVVPVPAPTPQVTGVTIGPARLGPPFARGALINVTGAFFGERPTVVVGGLEAQVISVAAGELGVVLPESLPAGSHALTVRSEGATSAAWMIEAVPEAPVLLFGLNEDGEPNAEAAPATRGRILSLYCTGAPIGATIAVTVHDRRFDTTAADGRMAGVRLIPVQVPADLPAMKTSATLSAGAATSHPLDIWIR